MKLDYQVDMHMHTAESDGTWELEEVLENIREKCKCQYKNDQKVENNYVQKVA